MTKNGYTPAFAIVDEVPYYESTGVLLPAEELKAVRWFYNNIVNPVPSRVTTLAKQFNKE